MPRQENNLISRLQVKSVSIGAEEQVVGGRTQILAFVFIDRGTGVYVATEYLSRGCVGSQQSSALCSRFGPTAFRCPDGRDQSRTAACPTSERAPGHRGAGDHYKFVSQQRQACTTRTLLFAIYPDAGRKIEPMHGRFVIRLPGGFSNALAVKLAVLYMEQYLLSPQVRTAPWKVEDDIPTLIYLA